MANIAQLIREEITRISKRNTNAGLRRLRQENRMLKMAYKELKLRVAVLEKSHRALSASTAKASLRPSEDEIAQMRPTTDMVKRLRRKLGLSQAELAKLIGISDQAVYLWERKNGRIKMREAVRRRFAEIRRMKVRDVRKQLHPM